MQPEEIKQLIQDGLPDSTVEVDGDGTHFSAVVVSAEFAGKTSVQRHQRVYQTLGDRMGGEIHALSLQTYTPDEWEKKRDLRVT